MLNLINRNKTAMNSRRKFLLQGTLATTALIVAKPFKTIANTFAPATGLNSNNSKLVLLHTGFHHSHNWHHTVDRIASLKKNTGNLLLLHTGAINNAPDAQMKYDVTMPEDISNSSYQIFYKGNIKTAVIYAAQGENDVVKKVAALSTRLKKEKNCDIVVCLSQLGFKNKNEVDDIQLANESSHLDIILSSNPGHTSMRAYIARNSKKEEVIINFTAGKNMDFGNIEMTFDENRNKKSVAINNLRQAHA